MHGHQDNIQPIPDLRGRNPFLYVLIVTLVSLALIAANEIFNLGIPFTVHFLVGIVGALLVFVVWHAFLTKGWKRSLLLFGLSFLIAFSAEALGVNFGLIFGNYYYTGFLGIGLFGVPFLAALAWEPILYAAFSLTEVIAPKPVPQSAPQSGPTSVTKSFLAWLGVGALGALATTAWDLMIDPIAVHQGWWVWPDGGAYAPTIENGVPISNFMGWLGVSFVITLIYRRVAGGATHASSPVYLFKHGPLMLYAALFLTASGVTLTILERPELALIGLMAMGPFLLVVLFITDKQNNR
jgi:uncharacterized membrane protein